MQLFSASRVPVSLSQLQRLMLVKPLQFDNTVSVPVSALQLLRFRTSSAGPTGESALSREPAQKENAKHRSGTDSKQVPKES